MKGSRPLRIALREAIAIAKLRGHRLGRFVRGGGITRRHLYLARCEACWMMTVVNTRMRPDEGLHDGLALTHDCTGVFDISGSVATIERLRLAWRARQRASGAWGAVA